MTTPWREVAARVADVAAAVRAVRTALADDGHGPDPSVRLRDAVLALREIDGLVVRAPAAERADAQAAAQAAALARGEILEAARTLAENMNDTKEER